MGLFDNLQGQSNRDGAPQQLGAMAPQYNGNLGAPANYWQGNQMQIPGLAQYLAQAQGQGGHGMAGMMQGPAKKPPGGINGLLQGGLAGFLPALIERLKR